jgi:hypothetical protein
MQLIALQGPEKPLVLSLLKSYLDEKCAERRVVQKAA